MRQESALYNLKNAYLSEKARGEEDMGKIMKQVMEGSKIN